MRPIDADALQKQLSRKKAEVCNARYTEGFNDALLRFKSMIHAAPTVEGTHCATGAGCWLERNKDIILRAGREGREVDFYLNGRLFRIREVAQ